MVLGRLMSLLAAPLKGLQAGAPPDESRFSETVAIRARIALLQVCGKRPLGAVSACCHAERASCSSSLQPVLSASLGHAGTCALRGVCKHL